MLWSRVLLTKFSGHRVYLSKLTLTWPQLTPTWPLTPAMHYTLVRGSSHQIWQPYDISKADWPLDDLWPKVGSLRKYAHKPRGPVPYPHAKFQLDTSKHGEMHSRTYIYTHTYTPRLWYLNNIDAHGTFPARFILRALPISVVRPCSVRSTGSRPVLYATLLASPG